MYTMFTCQSQDIRGHNIERRKLTITYCELNWNMDEKIPVIDILDGMIHTSSSGRYIRILIKYMMPIDLIKQ